MTFRKEAFGYEYFQACKIVCLYVGSLGREEKSWMIVRTLQKCEPTKGWENEAVQSAYPGIPVL